MPDLAEKASEGDMSVFGAEVPGRGPSEADDRIGTPVGEPEEAAAEAPEPEPSTEADPVREQEQPAQPDPQTETATAVKMLQEVSAHLSRPADAPDPNQAVNTNIDTRLAQMEARMSANLEATESAIRAATQKDEAVTPEEKEINYDDPQVQAVLAEALQDPERAGNAIRTLVQLEAKRAGKDAQKGFDAEAVARKDAFDKNEQQKQIIATGLQHAHSLGDVEAAIVEQAATDWNGSFLGQYLMENPQYALTADGMVGAVLAVSRIVERAHQQIPEGGPVQNPPAPSTQRKSSAMPGRASNKTDANFNPDSGALTPAQEVNQGIRDATERHKSKMPFLFGN